MKYLFEMLIKINNNYNIMNNIPIVNNIAGKMMFYPVPDKLGASSFECNLSWENINNIINTYCNNKHITCVSSKTTSAFTIVYDETELDIIVYLHVQGYYVIDFKHRNGSLFTGLNIYSELKRALNLEPEPEPEEPIDENAVYDFDALQN